MFGIVSSRPRSARFASVTTTGAFFAAIALSGSTALAQQPQEIIVILNESSFAPKTVTVTVGQAVRLNLQNQGTADHNLSSDIPISAVTYQRADNDPSDLRRYEATNVLDTDAKAGQIALVTFTPSKAGTFEFHSGEGNDQQLGMVGSFVVLAAATNATAAAVPAPAVAAPPAAAASTRSLVARDGQSLSSQSSATQAMFAAVWGAGAAQRWVQEHEAALAQLGR